MRELFRPLLPNFPLLHQGKTRDTYVFPYAIGATANEELLLVHATDSISTHDIVHESTIPLKGQVLTALTVFWFMHVLRKSDLPNHMIAYGSRIYDYLPDKYEPYPKDLHLSAIVVRKLDIIPVEFIFRSYLAGSLYREFYIKGEPDPYGLNLPPGLPKMRRFDDLVFTPTKKSDEEHDPPLRADAVEKEHPIPYALSRHAYKKMREYLNVRGLALVDSKFEVGVDRKNGKSYLADEVATPDSSRFARTDLITEGEDPPWLDKQIARDEAERRWREGEPRGPLTFHPFTVSRLADVYKDVFKRITGMSLAAFQQEHMQ
jgi:phosphoribosylaminoimidazole-succinocarboxamide synthase